MRAQFIVLLILSGFVLLIGFSQQSNSPFAPAPQRLAKGALIKAVSKLAPLQEAHK